MRSFLHIKIYNMPICFKNVNPNKCLKCIKRLLFYVKKHNEILNFKTGYCKKLTKISGLLDLFIVGYYNVLTIIC